MGADAATPARALSARTATVSIVAQLVARAITLGVVIASTAIVTRTIGIDEYADWATALALCAMLAFVLDPGITPVIVRRISQQPDTVPEPGALVALRLTLAVGAVIVVCAVTAVLRGPSAVPLALVLAAQAVPRALVLNAGAWLQADHRLHRQAALEGVTAALGLAALAGAAVLDAPAVVLAGVGFVVPTCLLAVLMARELARTPSRALVLPGPQMDRVRAIVHEVRPLALALLLVAVYARMHVVFVNAAEDAAGVARFLFAWQFVEQTYVVAGVVAATLLPLLAARAAAHNLRNDRVTLDLLVATTVLGGLASALLVTFAGPITRVIGGPQLAGADRDLTLLSPMATLIVLAFMLGYVYLALGEGGRYLRFNLVALIFNLAAHATLTLRYGADGAARVSWLTEVVVALLAFAPLWTGGRSTGMRLAACVAAAIAGAELTAGGVLAPVAGGLLIAAAALLLGGRHLGWLVSTLRAEARR